MQIVGTFILRNLPEIGYNLANWNVELDYNESLVIYTFAIHPRHFHRGIGSMLMDYIVTYAAEVGMKAIRLDVYEKNIPAINLYEKMEFSYVDTIDLGYGKYGLVSAISKNIIVV